MFGCSHCLDERGRESDQQKKAKKKDGDPVRWVFDDFVSLSERVAHRNEYDGMSSSDSEDN